MWLRSEPAVELNPYASPSIAGGYEDHAADAVGHWHDGKYLVLHPAAQFPPICIKTGQPATRFVPWRLAWSYPIDWKSRQLPLHVPFCETGYRQHRRRRIFGICCLLISLVPSVALQLLLMREIPRGMIAVAVLVLVCGLTLWAVSRFEPLRFIRVRGQYLWLSGADARFLEQLPPWTSGA
jgi:hypothetical protein